MKPRAVFGLRIPERMNTELAMVAEQYGITKNDLILKIFRDWVIRKDDGKIGK